MQGHHLKRLDLLFHAMGLVFQDRRPNATKMRFDPSVLRRQSPNPTVRSARVRDLSLLSPKATFSPLGFVVGAPDRWRALLESIKSLSFFSFF
ncbi:hypothetical protein GQ457_07G008860 [Hibiscus cannabinus]